MDVCTSEWMGWKRVRESSMSSVFYLRADEERAMMLQDGSGAVEEGTLD